jgi:hypothetical protein
MTLERVRSADNSKAVATLERIGADPTQWDLRAWSTNMAWAFRTNLPTPNLDRKLLLPLALSSPIYTLRDLHNVFMGFQWSTTQMYDELISCDARRLGTRLHLLARRWVPAGPGGTSEPLPILCSAGSADVERRHRSHRCRGFGLSREGQHMSTSQAAPSMGSAIGAAISLTIFTSFLGEGVTIVGEVLHTQGMQENAPIRQADW